MLLPILKSRLFPNTLIWVISRTRNHGGVVPQSSDVSIEFDDYTAFNQGT